MQHHTNSLLTNFPKITSSQYCGNPIAQQVIYLVSQKENIPINHLLHHSRLSRPTAEGRKLAMYLIHVCCGLNLTETGTLFGRDRTTVRHACACVEDRRDDCAFDDKTAWFEEMIEALIEAEALEQTAQVHQ